MSGSHFTMGLKENTQKNKVYKFWCVITMAENEFGSNIMLKLLGDWENERDKVEKRIVEAKL